MSFLTTLLELLLGARDTSTGDEPTEPDDPDEQTDTGESDNDQADESESGAE